MPKFFPPTKKAKYQYCQVMEKIVKKKYFFNSFSKEIAMLYKDISIEFITEERKQY